MAVSVKFGWLALVCLVGLTSATPQFNQTQLSSLVTLLASIPENYFTEVSQNLGIISCYDTTPGRIQLDIQSSFLRLIQMPGTNYANVLLRGKDILDFEIEDNQNSKDYIITCKNTDSGFSDEKTYKILIKDVNDNAPFFDRTGANDDTYQTRITEEITGDIPFLIYDNIIVRDIDGVDNNGVMAYCERIETNEADQPCEGSGLFEVRSTQINKGQYRFSVYALSSRYEALSDFVLVIKAINVPVDTKNNPVLNSTTQNVLITIQDIQNMPPFIDKNSLDFDMLENHTVGQTIAPGRYIRAQDQDTGDPNPIRFELVPYPEDFYGFENRFFFLGPVLPPVDGEGFYQVQLFLNKSIDREAIPDTTKAVFVNIRAIEYALNASDPTRNPQSTEDTITIRVDDINDRSPDFNQMVYNINVTERFGNITDPDNFSQISNNVNIQIDDLDSNAYNRYNVNIISGNGGNIFSLNSNNGSFRQGFTLSAKNRILDYETLPNIYQLVLKATDQKDPRLTSTAIVNIQIVDLNDNRPQFNQASYDFTVQENTANGTTVGTIAASDADSGHYGQITKYEIVDTSNTFTINSANGVITTNAGINYESRASYTFSAIAIDGGGEETSILVTVNVLNQDDVGPLFRHNYSALIYEESYELIPQIVLVAENREGTGDINYSVESVSPATIPVNTFNVGTLDGVVTVNTSINFQDTVEGIVKVTFRARAGTLSSFTTATITVVDINNHVPTFIPAAANSQYFASVSEAAVAGTEVIDLNVEDLDGPTTLSGQYEFSFVRGADDAFSVGPDSGILMVANNRVLDRERKSTYEIVVRVRDKGTPVKSSTATVIVSLIDANNKAPAFRQALYLFQMKEDFAVGAEIDRVNATDPDGNPLLHYSIDYTSLRFEKKTQQVQENIDGTKVITIDTNLGILRVAGVINRALYDRFSLNVVVEDKNADANAAIGIQTATASVFVTILAAVDPSIYFSPPWTKEKPVITKIYSESPSYNYQILTLKATDPTIPDNINIYRKINSSDPMNYFDVQGLYKQGFVYLKKPLDYEALPANKELSVVILAIADDFSRTGTATIKVTVQDLNDNEPKFDKTSYSFSVAEDRQYPFEVGTISATDADSSSYGEIRYFLPAGSDFGVYTRRTGSGDVAVLYVAQNSTLDFETQPEYNLQLTAEDNPDSTNGVRLRSTVNVMINLTDINDHPPTFKELVYDFSVVGTKEVSGEVGFVLAEDLDTGYNGKISYSIQSATNFGSNYFGIKDDVQQTAQQGREQTFGIIYVRNSLESIPDRSLFQLTVIAIDKGIEPVFTGTTNVRITVSKGVQDPKPKWDIGLPSRVKIPEHSPLNTFVAHITARPANESSGILYQFVRGGDATGDYLSFNINRTTGRITVARDLDYETRPIYSLLILASDSMNASLTNQYLLVVAVEDINDNLPSFKACKDYVYGIPEITSVMEDLVPAVYVYTVRACDNDKEPNNYIQYSWYSDNTYCRTDVQDVFNLDEETGVITTKVLLDREERDMYLLCISAAPASRRKRDMAADLKARTNHDTVLYLQVNVLDANDNGPTFNKSVDKTVILQYPSAQVTVAEAFDPDMPPNNTIRYSIENITFTIYGKSQMAPTAFSINAADGTISAGTNDYTDYVGGYFTIHVKAEDKLKPSNPYSRQIQTVYVTTKASQIRVVIPQPADSGVEQKAQNMINELNGLEDGVYYEIKKISYHIVSNDQDPQFDRTDVCMIVIRDESVQAAVTAAKDISDTSSVMKVLNKYGAMEPGPCDPARSIYPVGWESYWWVLVAFAIFIFICVCILIIMICALHRSYRRYMDTRKTYLVEATPM